MKLSAYIRDAALLAIVAFLWAVNSRLAVIETNLNLLLSGKIHIASKP